MIVVEVVYEVAVIIRFVILGPTKVAPADKTLSPVPVDVDVHVPPLATGSIPSTICVSGILVVIMCKS